MNTNQDTTLTNQDALIDIKPLKQADVVQIIRTAESLDDAVNKMNGLAANGWLTLWDNATHPDGTSYRDLPEWKQATKASIALVDELKAATKASEQRINELEALLAKQLNAIEHAEYLAGSAESLLKYLNDMTDEEECVINPDDRYGDYAGNIRNYVYEFRKRAQRARVEK